MEAKPETPGSSYCQENKQLKHREDVLLEYGSAGTECYVVIIMKHVAYLCNHRLDLTILEG